MAAYDDLNIKRIVTVGIISIIVTGVTALAVQLLYYTMVEWQQEETAALSDYRRQNQILAEQTSQISSFGVDPDTGKITIPIEDAIKRMVNEKKKASGKKSGSDET